MITNFWEELDMKNISDGHEKLLSEMEIPTWMNLNCPFCKKKLPLRSIREFGVKLNARNLCDIYVVICCNDCLKMDTLYFKSQIEKIPDFIGFLNGSKTPTLLPVLEEDMYKSQYNNLFEKIIEKKQEPK